MIPHELGLYSEVFDEFRQKLDRAIRVAVARMAEKKLTAGTVTAKIGIELTERTDERTGEILIMPEFDPEVSIRIGAKGKLSCAKVGDLILHRGPNGESIVCSNQIGMDEVAEEPGKENSHDRGRGRGEDRHDPEGEPEAGQTRTA